MFDFFYRRRVKKMAHTATVMWLEELDELITIIDSELIQLKADVQDLTDFVEDRLD